MAADLVRGAILVVLLITVAGGLVSDVVKDIKRLVR